MSPGPTHNEAAVRTYQALPQLEGNFIRCLVLSPGSGSDPLACELRTVNLDSQPDFEAISYVWGSAVKSETISCGGGTIQITENLSSALRRVRYASEPRLLWADSICIDQDNDEEKSHQVALMGKIYSLARRVLIHLVGGYKGGAASVRSLVLWLNKIIDTELSKVDLQSGDVTGFPSADTKRRLSNHTVMQHLRALIHQSWFHRGWVIQEAALAKEAVFLWGPKTEINYRALVRCINWMAFHCPETIGSHNLALHMILHRDQFREESSAFGVREIQLRFLHLLHLARGLDLSSPIDRVYAFLSLAAKKSATEGVSAPGLILQPDYTKSAEAVYVNLSRQCLAEGDLRALQYVQHTGETLADKTIPTWVARWNIRKHNLTNPYNCPSLVARRAHSGAEVRTCAGTTIEQGVLGVRGVLFDRTTKTFGPPVGGLVGLEDTNSYWRSLNGSDNASAYSPENQPLAFLAALVRGMSPGGWSGWAEERGKLFELWAGPGGLSSRLLEEDAVTAVGEQTARMLSRPRARGLLPLIQDTIAKMTVGRKIVCTERGYIGNVPLPTREGDLCCIVFGATTPSILRRVTDEEGESGQRRFLLVGDAWIPGREVSLERSDFSGMPMFGREESKEWVGWDIEEKMIYIA